LPLAGRSVSTASAEKNLLGFRARASRISSLASGRGGLCCYCYCGGQQSGLRIKKAAVAVVPYEALRASYGLRATGHGYRASPGVVVLCSRAGFAPLCFVPPPPPRPAEAKRICPGPGRQAPGARRRRQWAICTASASASASSSPYTMRTWYSAICDGVWCQYTRAYAQGRNQRARTLLLRALGATSRASRRAPACTRVRCRVSRALQRGLERQLSPTALGTLAWTSFFHPYSGTARNNRFRTCAPCSLAAALLRP
jgi:hypothetical protein